MSIVLPRPAALAAFGSFVATVWLANFLIARYGIVSVGFGLAAPAGVFAVGAAFTLRDALHRLAGRGAVVLAIACGAGLSFAISPAFATASAVAFAASELCDLAVYDPLSRRSWLGGVVASNIVGTLVDSYIFLSLAFGSLAFYWGQVVGKLWITAATVGIVALVRAVRA